MVRTDNGAAEPAVDHLALGRHLKYGGEGELVLSGAQGAEVVAEFFREHRHGAVYKVDGSAARLGFLVNQGIGLYII